MAHPPHAHHPIMAGTCECSTLSKTMQPSLLHLVPKQQMRLFRHFNAPDNTNTCLHVTPSRPSQLKRPAAPAASRPAAGPSSARCQRRIGSASEADSAAAAALALAGGPGSVRGTPLGTLLAQWKEAQATWAAEKVGRGAMCSALFLWPVCECAALTGGVGFTEAQTACSSCTVGCAAPCTT